MAREPGPNRRALPLAALLLLAPFAGARAAPKLEIAFPADSYAVPSAEDRPGWVKFTILTSDLTTVYFQDGNLYPFHYDFAVAELAQFAGMTPAQFDAVTLHAAGQQAILGAVILPPLVGGRHVHAEYGIELVRQDAYARETVRDLFTLVRSKVLATPDVVPYYFPAFEQQAVAEANADWLAAQGIPISSTARWAAGNSCYSTGWALGTLEYVPPSQIDAAYLAGTLAPGDILLTDAVPAEIPSVAGVLTLGPATPNSHVVILSQTFALPFAHLALAPDAARAQALVGQRIALRVESTSGACRVRLVDTTGQLDPATVQEILALKVPPPLDIAAVEPRGAWSASADGLGLGDVRHFGGKASNFGVIRRAIPASSPVATAFSFDLWSAYLDQTLSTGRTLRAEIALRLSPYAWPPDIAALDATLAGIRDLFRNTSQSAFSPLLDAAVIATLQDPAHGFDPLRNLRFRSSTNVEDAERFTGAGLYDSYSGCLADDLDADTAGPSLCDPTESGERGVFRAIRRVFASFYNRNAYLERLRYGVDEAQVGMALLVHHSFPDPIELANGVGLLEQSGISRSAYLVTQLGASSVTNPEPGAIPEEVEAWVDAFGGNVFPTLVRPSNLVPLGATVLEFPAEYAELTSLLVAVAERYELETGLGSFTLDFEYKKLAPEGRLSVDQVRRVPPAAGGAGVTPFLLDEPAEYCLLEGEYGEVFGNHRLKSRWQLSTRNLWLTPANLAASFYDDCALAYSESCQTYAESGPLPQWPEATHAYAAGTATDGWRFASLQNPRTHRLDTTAIPELVAPSASPLLVLGDFGRSYPGFADGCLELRVDYAHPVPTFDWNGPTTTTTDLGLLCRCPLPQTGDRLETRTLTGPAGVSIVTRFYWPADVPVAAGYTAPAIRFVDTLISGLTPAPIVLDGGYSQTYRPEHHNFAEHFLFEPALEPDLPPEQKAALDAAGIRAIHVRYSFGTAEFTYYGDVAWGGPCLGCTGFDADRDGRCTGAPSYDCDDADGSVWARPGEARDLLFASRTGFAWSPPQDPGAAAVRYDAIRAPNAADFLSGATCLATDVPAASASDAASPAPGSVFFYLARAENDCPAGSGPLGFASDGSERDGRACP